MRRVFALLMMFALVVFFMTMPAYALEDVNNGKGDNSGNNPGGSPTPVVGEGQQKELGSTDNSDENLEENVDEKNEENVDEKNEENVDEKNEEGDEEKPEEDANAKPEDNPDEKSEEDPDNEPDPNLVLDGGERQKVTEPAAETEPAVEATEDPTEMFLLVALITGLGAICVVLLIRRVLDL